MLWNPPIIKLKKCKSSMVHFSLQIFEFWTKVNNQQLNFIKILKSFWERPRKCDQVKILSSTSTLTKWKSGAFKNILSSLTTLHWVRIPLQLVSSNYTSKSFELLSKIAQDYKHLKISFWLDPSSRQEC